MQPEGSGLSSISRKGLLDSHFDRRDIEAKA